MTVANGNDSFDHDNDQYVDKLPRGDRGSWTRVDKRYVMLVSWQLMHELAHAFGSLLASEHVIKDGITPTKATGFLLPNGDFSDLLYSDQIEIGTLKRTTGERGWYLEDKLGGHLHWPKEVYAIFLPSKAEGSV